MENKIKKVMSTVFEIDSSELNHNSSPDSIENWDSLRHMNLVVALEEEFNVEFDDFDGKQEIMDAKWSLSGKFNSYRFAEHFSDLELMPLDRMFVPTLVLTEMSWAAIKAENWGD